jgi:hypothetical protein
MANFIAVPFDDTMKPSSRFTHPPRAAAARAARWVIVGVALALLAGCSALRLGYNTAPQLSWWWVDGQFDFTSAQAPAVRQSIDGFFDWHRRTQLPDLATLLASAQPALAEPTTAEAACQWYGRVRDRIEPAIDHALVQSAELVPTLTEANFKHLEQRYAKALDEMREEFLQPDPAKRRAEASKRTIGRVEQVYGSLEEPQRRVIAAGLAQSPFDPEAWMNERKRRQADTVQTLRSLVAEKADRDRRIAALRALSERSQLSPDPAHRAYQRKLTAYNCEFAAQIHNAMTPAQRQKAQQRFKGWEEDLRALIAQPAAPQ